MDSSLINLIPNLLAHRSLRKSRSKSKSNRSPTAPPSSAPTTIPLRIELLSPHKSPLVYVRDDIITLTADTTWELFLALVHRVLEKDGVSRDKGTWELDVVAEYRLRALWKFDEPALRVREEN
jgi:hypothetical protein